MRPAQQTAATSSTGSARAAGWPPGCSSASTGPRRSTSARACTSTRTATIEGTMTGGCVESAVAQEALALIARAAPPRLVDLRDLRRARRDGRADVRRDGPRLRPRAPPRRPRRGAAPGLEALVERAPERGRDAARRPARGRASSSSTRTRARGSLGGPELLDRNVEREARGLVAHGRTTVRRFGEDGTTLGTGLRVHVTAHAEPPRMVIFGAIDFSAALAQIAAGLGYRVTIADPRRAFLDSPRFAAFAETVAAWPDDGAGAHAARPARRGAGLHARREARRPRADGGVRAPTPATSARSAAGRRRPTARRGCATRAPPTPTSRACTRRAGSTSARRRWRRRRSPSWPR